MRLTFGDILINHYAGEGNPIKQGVFVRRTSKGIECTDTKGKFWVVGKQVEVDGKLEKIGNVTKS